MHTQTHTLTLIPCQQQEALLSLRVTWNESLACTNRLMSEEESGSGVAIKRQCGTRGGGL
ncbi:hypothetical protein EXN66_Car021521 [Channa argus]|uniref:Uncharacterized protein n=1 Tax=Channa argus TaxID=215402 RepID=A0A6G1QSY5_CHAAH|nr:hypothetical protein EXN66_Car021521 [Channa argus]